MNAEELLKEYYRKIAPMHDKIFHGDTEGEFYEMDQYLLKCLERWCPQQSEMILEAGCGTGYWLEYLARIRNSHIVGVDISPEMTAIAANRYAENPKIEIYQGDVRNLDFLEDCTFDFVFCPWVFQYLVKKDDFKDALRELKRVTKWGGILLLAEDSPPTKPPFTDCLVEKDELGGIYFYEDYYEGMTLPIYRRLLNNNEMTAALKKEGLHIVSCQQKISLKVYVVCRLK
ncbi:MAG: class I SAM-dependent methyltransferase [Theionarchaea archaeon]|nr:class I SAM-dependent methyltransferase [Theionarchaea archaeon]